MACNEYEGEESGSTYKFNLNINPFQYNLKNPTVANIVKRPFRALQG